jgi:aryl-alcohol dehydrogenase-like predicted oxidoreductase
VLEELLKSWMPPSGGIGLILKHSSVMLPILGTSSPKHLDENIAAAALELPRAEFERLSAVTPPPKQSSLSWLNNL